MGGITQSLPGHMPMTWMIRTGTTTAHMARPTNWPSSAHEWRACGLAFAWRKAPGSANGPQIFRCEGKNFDLDPPFVTIVLVAECHGRCKPISFVDLSEGLGWKKQMKKTVAFWFPAPHLLKNPIFSHCPSFECFALSVKADVRAI